MTTNAISLCTGAQAKARVALRQWLSYVLAHGSVMVNMQTLQKDFRGSYEKALEDLFGLGN